MKFPNGFGSIVYLGKKRRRPYAIRKTVGWELRKGKACQVYKYIDYFATKKEALIALSKLNDKVIDVKKIDYTFDYLYQEWMEKAVSKKKESSQKQIKYNYCHLSSVKDMKVKDITESMLQGILDSMTQGYSSRQVTRQIMQAVMSLAQSKAIRGDNPSTLLDIGKPEKSTKHKDIPPKDIEMIRKVKNSDSIIFLTYNGMRVNELLRIEIKDIHLEEGYLIGGLKSEAGKDRIIPIHRSMKEYVAKQMQGKKRYLYEKDGKKLNYDDYRHDYWNPVMEYLGLDYTPHDTRHTFVTNMRNAGVDKIVYQKIVGHKGTDVTDRVYTHIKQEELIQAVDRLP